MITMPIIATNTNNPAMAGTKYMSAADCGATVAGVRVVAGLLAWKAVEADDG